MLTDEIRSLLAQLGTAVDLKQVADGDSLLTAGVIDSVAMVELIAQLESSYAISIGEDELVPENFDSIRDIAVFVQTKRGGQ
jgi:acyl carrier protein